MKTLREAAQSVVDRWEKGDLAEAVRELQEALNAPSEEILVTPMIYEGEELSLLNKGGQGRR